MTGRTSQGKPPTSGEFARLHEVKRAVFLYLKIANPPMPGEVEALGTFAGRLERSDRAAHDWDESLALKVAVALASDRDGNPIFESEEVDRALATMRHLRDVLHGHIDIVKKMARASLAGPTGHQEPPLRGLVFSLAQAWLAHGGHPGFSTRPAKPAHPEGDAGVTFSGPFLGAVVAAVKYGVKTLNLPETQIPTLADIAKEIRALRREGRLTAREGN